jgi:hypothetical protein
MPASFIARFALLLVFVIATIYLRLGSSQIPSQTPVANPTAPTQPRSPQIHPSSLVDTAAASPKFIFVFLTTSSTVVPKDELPANEETTVLGGHDSPDQMTEGASFFPSTNTATTVATATTAATTSSSYEKHVSLDQPGDEQERVEAVKEDLHSTSDTVHTAMVRPVVVVRSADAIPKPMLHHGARPFQAYDQYMSDYGISWWLWFVYAAMVMVCSVNTKGLQPHALRNKIDAFLPDTLLLAWMLAHTCCLALRPVLSSLLVSAMPIVGVVALWPKLQRLGRKLGIFPLRKIGMPALGLWNGTLAVVLVLLLPPMLFRATALIYVTSCSQVARELQNRCMGYNMCLAYSEYKRFIEQAVNKLKKKRPRAQRPA